MLVWIPRDNWPRYCILDVDGDIMAFLFAHNVTLCRGYFGWTRSTVPPKCDRKFSVATGLWLHSLVTANLYMAMTPWIFPLCQQKGMCDANWEKPATCHRSTENEYRGDKHQLRLCVKRQADAASQKKITHIAKRRMRWKRRKYTTIFSNRKR